jgi:hypothetical protein
LRDSDKGPQSVSAPIDRSPKPPVLMDGLFAHTSKQAIHGRRMTLPNISCSKCTLQIIQFMAEHGRNSDGDFLSPLRGTADYGRSG